MITIQEVKKAIKEGIPIYRGDNLLKDPHLKEGIFGLELYSHWDNKKENRECYGKFLDLSKIKLQEEK